MEHGSEEATGESEEMAIDCLGMERSMTLSAFPTVTFFSLSGIQLPPRSLSMPVRTRLIGGPPSIERAGAAAGLEVASRGGGALPWALSLTNHGLRESCVEAASSRAAAGVLLRSSVCTVKQPYP